MSLVTMFLRTSSDIIILISLLFIVWKVDDKSFMEARSLKKFDTPFVEGINLELM
ncbi:hypothetical protein GCM10007096_41360 [Pullulanibacillus pueri]|uniref:Uncharacterized protein n=1 Tax=Pullulanibacillus pueri TaxID=1437324 RepID=A0A8J2ZZP5_9BACL|nr:hypothetical protein GCM10007096_41360 [Pullulanibacillus pueri]